MSTKGADGHLTVQEWLACWGRAAPTLAKLRDQEIRDTDTIKALESLADAFNAALRMNPTPAACSGLVEFYKILTAQRDSTC